MYFIFVERGRVVIKHMPISETRKNINSFVSNLSFEDTISVTNRGKEVLAIIPWETYESITETLEILSDESIMKDLKKGIEDVKNGNLVDFNDLKKELSVV